MILTASVLQLRDLFFLFVAPNHNQWVTWPRPYYGAGSPDVMLEDTHCLFEDFRFMGINRLGDGTCDPRSGPSIQQWGVVAERSLNRR